jgi:V/A-type H+-transporting ATPase subunit I
MEKPVLLLMFCLGIGVVHLSLGYILKARWHLKHRRPLDAFFDAGFPILVMLPLVLVFISSEIFLDMAGFSITLSKNITDICLWISLASMLGIVLFAGRDTKGIGRIFSGLYVLYNTLAGWLSDTLSYSRLLALGLATGVIASVMNQIGSMAGGGIVGFILFLIVFVIGQTLNFGINVLGAYVHSNRLAYVEFFSKFYEGGGQKFEPFKAHTQHIKIEEDLQNG